jgi:thiol-disulfide isomerase/thioredoxin
LRKLILWAVLGLMVALAVLAAVNNRPSSPQPIATPTAPTPVSAEASEATSLSFHAPQAVMDGPFQSLDGTARKLSDFKGKVLIVNLWATWCAPCIKEMPALARLNKALPADKFQVLAISLDRSGPQAVSDFWARLALDGLQPFIDPTAKLGFTLQTQGMPTTLILDANGLEIARVSGALAWDAPGIVDQIRKLQP